MGYISKFKAGRDYLVRPCLSIAPQKARTECLGGEVVGGGGGCCAKKWSIPFP